MIWRDVVGYEGVYGVSDYGTVRRVKSGRILRQQLIGSRPDGRYYSVTLCQHGVCVRYVVHRLVALAFLPLRDAQRIQVNHKDANKLNNALSNLEWCTPSENVQHAADMGLGVRGPIPDEQVRGIRAMYAAGYRCSVVARAYGYEYNTVMFLLRGDTYRRVS